MNALSHLVAGLLLAVSSATLIAAELPSYYPSSFEKIGVINSLPSASNNNIVISDSSFGVVREVRVHTLAARNASLAALKTGQLAGFTVVGAGPASKGEVAELWTLPPDFKIPR